MVGLANQRDVLVSSPRLNDLDQLMMFEELPLESGLEAVPLVR